MSLTYRIWYRVVH